jgi:hypothetical protein
MWAALFFSSTHMPKLIHAEGNVKAVQTLNLNSVNQLIFVMVKCGVLFEVRTGFLNNI